MKITARQLKAVMPNIETSLKANKYFKGYDIDMVVTLLNKYAEEFQINTAQRWIHFLAQIAHESGQFRYSEEIATGSAYEGRRDIGNTQKGDGVKFKGRGLIQITGRANYTAYKKYCGFDVVAKPELLAQPIGAIRSAMWFWYTHNLNYYADIDATLTITKKFNGGTNGLSDRMRYVRAGKSALL